MDTAVALVQAYLNVNGYFTVTEYPVMEAYAEWPARTATDLDLLAFRFRSPSVAPASIASASAADIRGGGR